MQIYYWWIIRIPVILFLPSLFYDFEIIFLIISYIFLHITFGLKTILHDYIHNDFSKIFLTVLIRICNLEFLRYTLEFLI